MAYDIRRCSIEVVRGLCERFHIYESAGGLAVDAFAVYENGEPVAGYAWQPPPPGAAKGVCPEAPQGVLALSRMVAVPKSDRALKHVSKPLREQMKRMIDRTRWPVLVTYSDEGAATLVTFTSAADGKRRRAEQHKFSLTHPEQGRPDTATAAASRTG